MTTVDWHLSATFVVMSQCSGSGVEEAARKEGKRGEEVGCRSGSESAVGGSSCSCSCSCSILDAGCLSSRDRSEGGGAKCVRYSKVNTWRSRDGRSLCLATAAAQFIGVEHGIVLELCLYLRLDYI